MEATPHTPDRTARELARGGWNWRWQLQTPAWLTSLVLHLALMLILGYVAQQELHGTDAPAGAEFIASVSGESQEDFFDDEVAIAAGSLAEAEPTSAGDGEEAGAKPSSIFGDEPPVETAGALPAMSEYSLDGAGLADAGSATGAGDFTQGQRGPARLTVGKGRTHVYGLEGEGNSFVYVFDRSASMGDGGGSPLAAAKRQLLASLNDLNEGQQFQIIFYNHKPTVMKLGRQFDGMVFADEDAKRSAERFIGSVFSDGATEHEAALKQALRLGPDVIFFLTDGVESELSPAQLASIRRLNGGRTSINAIEFGTGAPTGRYNFLKRLTSDNGGKYVYIDVTKRSELR